MTTSLNNFFKFKINKKYLFFTLGGWLLKYLTPLLLQQFKKYSVFYRKCSRFACYNIKHFYHLLLLALTVQLFQKVYKETNVFTNISIPLKNFLKLKFTRQNIFDILLQVFAYKNIKHLCNTFIALNNFLKYTFSKKNISIFYFTSLRLFAY